MVDEVGIDPQRLGILRGRGVDGGQAVRRPLVDLRLGLRPLGRIHGVGGTIDRLHGPLPQQGRLDLPGTGEPEQLRVIPVNGINGLLDHVVVGVQPVDGLRLVFQARQKLVVEILLLPGEGRLGVAKAVLNAGVLRRRRRDSPAVGEPLQRQLTAGQAHRHRQQQRRERGQGAPLHGSPLPGQHPADRLDDGLGVQAVGVHQRFRGAALTKGIPHGHGLHGHRAVLDQGL